MYTKTKIKEQNIALIKKVYASTDLKSEAKAKIDRHYQTDSLKGQSSEVSIEAVSLVSDKRYQVDFSVKQNDLIQRYKALLCFELKNVNAKSLETLRLNPLGIFINNITVSKIITKE